MRTTGSHLHRVLRIDPVLGQIEAELRQRGALPGSGGQWVLRGGVVVAHSGAHQLAGMLVAAAGGSVVYRYSIQYSIGGNRG